MLTSSRRRMSRNPGPLGRPRSSAPARTGSPGLNPISLLARFIAANQRLSKATENRLPAVFKRHIQTVYKYKAAELINPPAGPGVLDMGGGKECAFLRYLDAPHRHLIVALDLSEEELRRNRQLQHKIVADAAANRFPFRDGAAALAL